MEEEDSFYYNNSEDYNFDSDDNTDEEQDEDEKVYNNNMRGPIHRIEDDNKMNMQNDLERHIVDRNDYNSVCQYAEKYTRCVASDDILRCVDGSLGGVYKTFRFDPNVHDPDLFMLAQTQIRLSNMYQNDSLELIYRMGNLNELWVGGFYIQYRVKRLLRDNGNNGNNSSTVTNTLSTTSLNVVRPPSTIEDVRKRIYETFTNPIRIARLLDFVDEMWRRGQEVRYRVSYDDFVLTLPLARRMYAKLNGIHIITSE